MDIFCYTSGPDSNFGDDLNRWLWNRISDGPFDDDDTLLLGIGTIISRNLIPPYKKYIVLSSGVGYSPVPSSFGGPEWEILSVRGPLTAAALGLPPEKAIIDGAALLRLIPKVRTSARIGARRNRVYAAFCDPLHGKLEAGMRDGRIRIPRPICI